MIVFILKSWVIHDYGKINGDYIDSIYPTKDSLLKGALDEASTYSKRGNKSVLKGALKGFCDNDWENFRGDSSNYSKYGVSGSGSQQLINDLGYNFQMDNYWSYCILNSLGIFIIIVNTIMKEAIIKIVTWIGFRTQSKLNTYLTAAIFATRFINTAIILLVRKSSISGYSFPYLGAFIDSIYYDFDLDWYREIGSSIIIASVFNSISPIVDAGVDYLKKLLLRLNDKREFSGNKYTTRCRTVQKYVDLYGGSEYKIYERYSYIISMGLITFMFGSGLPLLYPIFGITLLILWIVDRVGLAYYYKQPPMFDDKLSNGSVYLLQFSICLQMLFGFLMFNNNQVFSPIRDNIESALFSDSFFGSIKLNHALPFLICEGFIFLYLFGEGIFTKVTKVGKSVWGFEGLPPFPKCLKYSDVEWIYTEERHLRRQENIKILSDKFYDTIESMFRAGEQVESKGDRKILQIATYDILANPIYQEMFQYFSVSERGAGSDPIFMSNKVRKILNLPYLSQNQIADFKFVDTLFKKLNKNK